MIKSNFDRCFEKVIGHEGGFSGLRSDPGNWTGGAVSVGELKGTKYGISAASYPHLDIGGLTLAEAKAIYQRDYWERVGADLLPLPAAYVVFDAGVNTGPYRARKWLQMGLRVHADGIIGPQTRRAIAELSPDAVEGFLCEFQAQRTWHHMKLDSMDDIYGLGWSRRIIEVTMSAMKWMENNQSSVKRC